jgi:hypothetical protein
MLDFCPQSSRTRRSRIAARRFVETSAADFEKLGVPAATRRAAPGS